MGLARIENFQEAKGSVAGVLDVVTIRSWHISNISTLVVESASIALGTEQCHPSLTFAICVISD